MERRLALRIRNHEKDLKNSIQAWFSENNCNIVDESGCSKISEFLQYVYDAEPIELTASDFMKRKRVKNDAPLCDRCTAKRADGNQCTRRKRDVYNYCGTHMKGTPHGVIEVNSDVVEQFTKIELTVVDIKGINYHIDAAGNVYDAKDIITGSSTPNIIAQYEITKTGEYIIPSLYD
jgi:hypothetical protein